MPHSVVLFSPLYVTLNDPEWPFYVKFCFFGQVQVQGLLIYLYEQRHDIYGQRKSHLRHLSQVTSIRTGQLVSGQLTVCFFSFV